MVIRLLIILLLSVICITIPAGATVVTTSGSGNLSALSFGVNDTIIVANTHTLTVDAANSTTTPIVRMIFVRSGGTLAFTSAMGLMCNAVVLGNRASAPFSSSNGGTLTMSTTSYLYLRHDAGFTYDVEIGPNATVNINVNPGTGSNAAQIYMDAPATNGYGRFYVGNTTASVNLTGVRFKGFIRAFGSGGVEFNASGRAPSTTTIYKCFFDTSNVGLINVTGHKVNQCTFNLPVINNNGAVYIAGGVKDTVWNTTITVDANGGAEGDQKGIYINNQDSTVIQGCTVQELNSTSFGANSYGILVGGDYAQIKHCTVSGFGFTIATASSADVSGLIDSCYGFGTNTTHEWVILHAGDTGWTIRGNDIRFISGGGRSAITFYPSTTPAPHAYIYYNTINAEYGGSPAAAPIGFEHTAAGNMVYNGVKMVGNILIGNNTGFNRAEIIFGTTATQTVTVNFSEFKNNAFDSCYYFGSSSATYPYSRLDSNKHDQTQFGFVDSASGDFRLSATSPMLNCGDSTYAVSVFGTAQASKAPFDIGYYQSYTTGTCGGSSPTPTGACCYNYTCAVVTQAQCTSLGGTYFGDGTSTCTNCTAPSGTNPSPYSKQLRIASLCYYAPWWVGNNLGGYVASMREWAANRYAMVITTGATPASVSYMKTINPNLKVIQYDLFGRHASDTAALRALCDTLGLSFKREILHTNTASVTTTMPTDGSGYGTTQSVTTTADSSPILFSYWINTQRRVSLDPRRTQAGSLLARRYKQVMTNGTPSDATDDIDGIMPDEEQRWTGLFPAEAPILPTSGDSAWATTILYPFTGINDAAFPDSQKAWRANWAKAVGDSMRAWNKIIIPNGTRLWGAHASQSPFDSGWKVEGRHATVQWGGALLNENHGVYWYNSSTYFRSWMKLAYDVKDSNVNIVLSWIPTGPPQTTCAGYSKPRDKMNFLGFALMCTFPTTNNSNVYFSPKWVSNYNDVYHNWGGARNFGCSVYNEPSDTLWEWSNAWGKYFGVASNTIDSTTNTGTDGAGQTYKVFLKAFTHPTTGLSQTFVAMRFTQGTTYGATSGVSVTLPGSGNWYELIENTGDSAGQGASVQAFWRSTPYTGGSTITLLNSQARVFSADTVLANAGYSQSSTGTISINDVSTAEGSTATFTATLSQAQSVVTNVNWITSPGSGSAGTDYVDAFGTISFGVGQTTAPINVTTIDRVGCLPSRTFNVTLYGATPTTITISDPTGVGTITDGDCGTTYGKTYKGKIVIKGKVKP